MRKQRKIAFISVMAVVIILLVCLFVKLKSRTPRGGMNRAEIIQINDAITLINDGGESTYYVVCGTEKALMIDTGNGYDDVMKVARTITDLPIEVVNTHGHNDHVYGNTYCDSAWIHQDDLSLIKSVYLRAHGKCCPLQTLNEGYIFELGDLDLEVIMIAGHTPGSIGLLDRKHRILFSGDAVNPYIWLQLPECLPLSQARLNISDMMEKYGDEFDYHLCGHTTSLTPKEDIYDLIKGCDEILDGNNKEDEDYKWFGGIGKCHPYGDSEGKLICYDPNNL